MTAVSYEGLNDLSSVLHGKYNLAYRYREFAEMTLSGLLASAFVIVLVGNTLNLINRTPDFGRGSVT